MEDKFIFSRKLLDRILDNRNYLINENHRIIQLLISYIVYEINRLLISIL